MIIARLDNIKQYTDFVSKTEPKWHKIWLDEKALSSGKRDAFYVEAISYPAMELVKLKADFEFSNGIEVNWRERLVCPKTGFNNRQRACIHFSTFEMGIQDYHKIYITEQVTPLYNYFKKLYPETIGSEFFGPEYKSGDMIKGIRHEDMTMLSFPDNEFDFYLSFECFEHIPDFEKAFSEAFRVLKNDGVLFFTVPFAPLSDENILRAIIDSDGELCHILEPEYHGDPVNSEGVLCYTHFGWQMLDDLRGAGFKKVYALLYWSNTFGYLGGQQICFVAKK